MYCDGGDPTDCHPPCIIHRGEEPLYLALLKAAKEGRIDHIIGIAPLAVRFLSYNVVRGTLQFRACDGEKVMTSIKVPAAAGVAYTVAMARPNARILATRIV